MLAVDREPDSSGPGESFVTDLTTRDGNRAAVEATLERLGRLDVIVPSAGFQHVSPVEEFDEDRWDALLALLLTSPGPLTSRAVAGGGTTVSDTDSCQGC